MSEYITRDGEDYQVIEEVAAETLGAMDIEPRWFYMPEGWQIEGNSAHATLGTYMEDGSVGSEKYRLNLTIERVPDE